MRCLVPLLVAALASGLFAAVSIARGGGLAVITTTGTTGLTTTTQAKVTLCHRTRSTKHPFVTITVATPAVAAHLRHGDILGCTVATITAMRRHGHLRANVVVRPGANGNHGNTVIAANGGTKQDR